MKQYVVDAFAEKVFEGNPAAVCIMEDWLDDDLMQAITIENNLSETAFSVKEKGKYHLRWFTPGGEIDLCGHATLATAFVLMNYYELELKEVSFETMSGELLVKKDGDLYELDFPSYNLREVMVSDLMEEAIGVRPIEAWIDRDLLYILESEEQIKNLKPNLDKVILLDGLLLNVSAKSSEYDCISRTFAPKLAIDEDPVCGSGHCHIVPYWANKLAKNNIIARQASQRGGTLYCKVEDNRIKMAGKAVLYAISELFLPTKQND